MLVDASHRVLPAKRILAVEIRVRASVPEVREIEHGVNHRRRVTRFNASHVDTLDVKNVIDNRIPFVNIVDTIYDVLSGYYFDEAHGGNALGGSNVEIARWIIAVDVVDERKIVLRKVLIRSSDDFEIAGTV